MVVFADVELIGLKHDIRSHLRCAPGWNDAASPGAQPVCSATISGGLTGNCLKGLKGLKRALERAVDHVKMCSSVTLSVSGTSLLQSVDAMMASEAACANSRTANNGQPCRAMYAMIPEGPRACRSFAADVAGLRNLNRPQRRRRPARRKWRQCLVGVEPCFVPSETLIHMLSQKRP